MASGPLLTRLVIAIAALLLSQAAVANECVILLHGLARSADSMNKIATTLTDENYIVINVDYPSREHSIAELSAITIPDALEQCIAEETSAVNFVTHSLGGILVRQYLSNNDIANLGRVVMLGPPNGGSEVVDKMQDAPGFDWINGPAGRELSTDDNSVPLQLGPVDFDLGVIAGTRSVNLLLSQMLPDEDDGKVSVERTRVEGMCGFVALPTTHVFMMRNKDVLAQISSYLDSGIFVGDDAVNIPCPADDAQTTGDADPL